MQIVIDTNVIASAIFFGGNPKKVIDYVMNGSIDAFVSKNILEEYIDTVNYLKCKFPRKHPVIPLVHIESKCKLIDVKSKFDVCRDPDDNKFLECAYDANCYYIVSGDKDLLSIEYFKGINILTVSEFLKILEEF